MLRFKLPHGLYKIINYVIFSNRKHDKNWLKRQLLFSPAPHISAIFTAQTKTTQQKTYFTLDEIFTNA